VTAAAVQTEAPPSSDDPFATALERIRAELLHRPPQHLKYFERFVERIQRNPRRFYELHGSDVLPAHERKRIEPRLEPRREAYVLVIGALLIWMDGPSLRVGKHVGGGRIFGVGQQWIAKVTGMALGRIRRAIGDLVFAKYLSWTQPIARYVKAGAPSGIGYAAWNAIYRFEVRFFERIDLDKKLARHRKRAAERRANRVRLYAPSLIRARAHLRRFRQNLWPLPPAPPPAPPLRPPRPKP
jgi:hypothetical protein